MKTEGDAPALYLPGLNGLRFLAAFAVLIHHVEQAKETVHLPNDWSQLAIKRLGEQGVTFFFVLSGYLITMLLMIELRDHDRISVRSFYVRRVLRIWPLYYMIVFLAFVVLPHFEILNFPLLHPQSDGAILCLSMCPQMLRIFTSLSRAGYAGILWSVGVEEHFYLLWPHLMNLFRKRLLLLLLAIIVGWFLMAWMIEIRWPDEGPISRALDTFRFQCMAIGGLFGWLAFREHKVLRLLFRRDIQMVFYAVFATLIYKHVSFGFANFHAYSACFAFIIVNVSRNPGSLFKLENRLWRFLGEISYGLYCYQWIVIVFVLSVVKIWFGKRMLVVVAEWGVLPAALLLTIGVSWLSFAFFERPFLRLKKRFSSILTGDDARVAGTTH